MKKNSPVVLTLDGGGTNLVFSAICNSMEIVEPVIIPTVKDDVIRCLETIKTGFQRVMQMLPSPPVAISFAFPGPADYESGVIGDLPNFPCFRGGVPLGPYLEDIFKIPVFINNDGNLFAYGEAIAGAIPYINRLLKEAGNPKVYKNILGVTLGTGFGGGIVIDGKLLKGDNQCGGYLWSLPYKFDMTMPAEEGVGVHAVSKIYAELSGYSEYKTPKDIFEIAEGNISGDKTSAIESFCRLGRSAGYAISSAVTLLDCMVVIGGGLSGASKYILPSLMEELNSVMTFGDGRTLSRLQMKAFNLEDNIELQEFLKPSVNMVSVPGMDKKVNYSSDRRIGVMVSKLGASRSISLGAYNYAINNINLE